MSGEFLRATIEARSTASLKERYFLMVKAFFFTRSASPFSIVSHFPCSPTLVLTDSKAFVRGSSFSNNFFVPRSISALTSFKESASSGSLRNASHSGPPDSAVSMKESLSLTFGIELECIVEYNPTDYDDETTLRMLDGIPGTRNYKIEILVRRDIARVLSCYGFPTTDWMQNPSVQTWVVDRDRSIELPPNKPGRSYLDIELKSPAYNLSPKAFDQVQSVIGIVTEKFNVHTDKSCGLHVHVGNQRKGFPLQTFKNFCMLTTIFEPQFNSLHPPSRLDDNLYLRPLTRAFEGVSPLDTALLIQSCRTHEQLVKRWTGDPPDRYYAYNFCPLVFKPIFGTIEFRNHKATLDTDAIRMWVRLACGLVRTAHEIHFGYLAHLMEHAASGMYMDAIALLSEIELHGSAEYYGRQRRYSHPRPAWAWVNPMVEETVGFEDEGRKDEFVNGEKIVKIVAKNALE